MNIGTIQHVDIDDQMRTAYLDYAMSVIVARALPDVRDGLKPVHRRILYAMHDMGLRSNTPFKKSARIVGEVLGKYHPHGDQAVYDSMVRMAQDFSMRYLLVDGQGNFGSVDGDSPAAMRYTEARLAKMAEEMLQDIDKGTVDWSENFDGSLEEPNLLPGRLPNLLLNGATGIAVGMATNIPPHNLTELAGAIKYLIDRNEILAVIEAEGDAAPEKLVEKIGLAEGHAQKLTRVIQAARVEESELSPEDSEDPIVVAAADEATVDELMVFVQGPDFPTGGTIVGSEGIVSAYTTGKGRVVIRGVAAIDEMHGGRHRIVVTEIPYQINKTSLIERIAELARQDRIGMISDLRDESDRNGMRIVIELKHGAQPKKVLNQLYKYTALQSTFGVQMLALIPSAEGGTAEPRLLSLRRALQHYIEHRRNIIVRRSEYELAKAKARVHILEGLLIAIANIDAIIKTIRASKDAEAARVSLIKAFDLTDVQAQAILDLQLRRLAALERLKIEQEHKEVLERIGYLEHLLVSPKKIMGVIKDDLSDLTEKYGDERSTRIAYGASDELNIEDMVADESMLVSITQRGYIKRMASKSFRAQGRGGKGVIGQDLRSEDEVEMMFSARSLQPVLFFSDKGKVYSEKMYEIPEAGRTDKGVSLHNILALGAGERITAAVPVPSFEKADFCTMVTCKGKIKRVPLQAFEAVRPSGLIAISLEKDDILGWAQLTLSGQEIIIVTEAGQALRFNTNLVRPMGRAAIGINAIYLKGSDRITGVELVDDEADLLVVTENGYGKRTPIKDYPAKGRATAGVATINRKSLSTIGRIVAARRVVPNDQITIISTNGQALRTWVKNIGRYGRATMGTRLMNLKDGDTVASVARLSAADLKGPARDVVSENGHEETAPPAQNGASESSP